MTDRDKERDARNKALIARLGAPPSTGRILEEIEVENQRRITLGGSGGPAVIDALAADGEVRGEQAATATGV
jgi:hypothetical protein